MYGKPKELTIQEILKRVSEWDLWSYYIPGVQVNKSFKSPLREDKSPSAALFIARNGNILFKDFAGETLNIWKFLQIKYSMTFIEVLLTVNNDFNLKLVNKPYDSKPTMEFFGLPQKEQVEKSAPKIIKIKRRQWSSLDKEYWAQYNLSTEFIEERGVLPVQNYWINSNLIYWHSDYNPTYSYEFGKGLRKLYAPKAKKFKFLTNAGDNIMQGFKFLPEFADTLIITKSYKDVLVLESLGYHSFAPQSESMTMAESIIKNIKSRFQTIYLLYDNDTTGVKYSNKICSMHNFSPIFVPKPDKDISDYTAKYGKDATIELLKTLL
jgi:hypothetical protein